MKETLSVYVVTHKKVDVTPLKLDHCYRLIRVGAYGNEPGHLLADNTGENIAGKNPYYCELTALSGSGKMTEIRTILVCAITDGILRRRHSAVHRSIF